MYLKTSTDIVGSIVVLNETVADLTLYDGSATGVLCVVVVDVAVTYDCIGVCPYSTALSTGTCGFVAVDLAVFHDAFSSDVCTTSIVVGRIFSICNSNA